MSNFRKVNEDDILKEWYDCMEETYLCYVDEQDRANDFKYDPFREKILKNVPDQNKKYVKKQLDLLDENFMDYICYWNEKYYRNGFCDGVQLIGGCFE